MFPKKTIKGIIQGTIGTVINHPIETALCVCAPQYLVAYHIGKIACVYLDVKITSLMDQEAGEQKLYDYMKPFIDCIDTIRTGDITLRGSIKVAATVATQVVVQGKVNAGLKTFYDTTKKRAKNYLKNNPTATAKQYLATPDGRLLQAAGGPGKNTHSLREMGGKGPKNSGSGLSAPKEILRVDNMKEFLKTKFGSVLKSTSQKTSKDYQSQTIYRLNAKIKAYGLDKGDHYYLDALHHDHLEVFNQKGKFKFVLNLDGSLNIKKTDIGISQGRDIKHLI